MSLRRQQKAGEKTRAGINLHGANTDSQGCRLVIWGGSFHISHFKTRFLRSQEHSYWFLGPPTPLQAKDTVTFLGFAVRPEREWSMPPGSWGAGGFFGPWKVLEPQTITLSQLAQGLQWQPSRPCSRESHKWSGLGWKRAPVLHSEWDTTLGKGNVGSKGDPDPSNPRVDAGAGRGQRNAWAPIWAAAARASTVRLLYCLPHSPQHQREYQTNTQAPQSGLMSALGSMSTAPPEP